jgi:hypothetical protein
MRTEDLRTLPLTYWRLTVAMIEISIAEAGSSHGQTQP